MLHNIEYNGSANASMPLGNQNAYVSHVLRDGMVDSMFVPQPQFA